MIRGSKSRGRGKEETLGDMEMKPLESPAPGLLFQSPIQLVSFNFVSNQQAEVDYLLQHKADILGLLKYEPDLLENMYKLFSELEGMKQFSWVQTQRILAREDILNNLNTGIIKSRIRASQKSQGGGEPTSLVCCYCHLTRFPGQVLTCTEYETYFKALKKLQLSNNHLTQLPAEMKVLISLEVLSLSNNKLPVLPGEMGALKMLQWVDLSDNRITEIPEVFAELPQLQEIHCHGNLISKFPKNLKEGIVKLTTSLERQSVKP